MLTALLDGELTVRQWRASEEGRRLISRIGLGALPRDVQVVDEDSASRVGVVSMHGFLRAPLFWWLVSILWCISPGSEFDEQMSESIAGYRLHRRFRTQPENSGLMFQDPGASYKRWQRSPTKAAEALPGAILAATTIDLRDFYYRVQARPTGIVRAFRSGTKPIRLSRRASILTQLLNVLHDRYAECDRTIRPRPHVNLPSATPLPVGPPSSRILANMVISAATRVLVRNPRIQGVAAYADDLMIVSRILPRLEERNADYLSRLGVISSTDSPSLPVGGGAILGDFLISLDKTGTSYSRTTPKAPSGEGDGQGLGDEREDGPNLEGEAAASPAQQPTPAWGAGDAYVEGAASPDWGGRLRTILRAPHKPASESCWG